MRRFQEMSRVERNSEIKRQSERYQKYMNMDLRLNMTRGKPGEDQLELSMPMLDVLDSRSDCRDSFGVDCRNYGELPGSMDARKLFGDFLGISAEETIVVGSSSLTFMYDCITRAMLTGVLGSREPWAKAGKIKFVCPVPGYDRHFTICEFLGIGMIPVELSTTGPDMETVRRLVKEDEAVKGIWCVPKYTNPYGGCYNDETVRALASMETKAEDFRIFWDNAYGMHYIYKDVPVLNILDECKKAGNPNRAYLFGSTSKITFPGAGVGFFGASAENIAFTKNQIAAQSISWDKMNMLRHVRFLKDLDGIRRMMDRQAALLRPKFDRVLSVLDQELHGCGAGEWVRPDGGYFITYIGNSGCAKRIHALCKQAGVQLTEPGATHPYHRDPEDRFLRIAPSYPPVEELQIAMEVFCTAAKIASLEALGI
ncbi:MAG: aminotransferase [Eubacteriales bacterium]|nr:aminotransferase [Eubacteriales bacterium]MDD3536711.1 aminotransferase [Eubacteriales bacterium]MDD4285934.1 aminotransferase [Eubacteriales bacterium]NLV69502.1 aminotransferase [Clostridiales bacterium]